jgi:integrase
VTGGREAATIDWVEAARGRCDPRALEDLWAAVPEPMRLSRFAESSVPPEYAGAFCHDGTWRAGVDLSQLPEPMRREVAWCVFRIIWLGGKIPTPGLSMLVRRLGEVIADRGGRAPVSLLGLSVPQWCQQFQRVVHRRGGRLPAAATMTNIRRVLTRMMRLLVTASDTGPWWQRDQWNPVEDNSIPLRDHEPMGRYSVRFDRIGTRWLRRGLQWHCKVGLDTGVLSWSTVHRRVVAVGEFDGFLAGRGVDGPWLADHAGGMRALMLDFLGHLRARPVTRGRRTGQRLSPASVQRMASDVEQFYLFMTDNKDAAAAALAEPGWLRLGPEHAGFYRRGELPGKPQPRLDGQVIDDEAMARIMGGLDRLGAAVADGGFGDEQAMRITMLVALLGRRVSEICLLDRDPLLPLSPTAPTSPGEPAAAGDEQALVAKLRYQQTKIDGAPDTILVPAEVVAIIGEQQQWAQRFFADHGAPGRTPKYLFLAAQMNRNGDRPYSGNTLRNLLSDLAIRLDVRDNTGALVDFNRTHRFRHTVATGLLNSGVPLHVLQRYLGHLTPTMSMTYAQTLQSTAEAEFLRFRKITADGREIEVDPRDLYDMLELDRRTDRILPNGYCLLPPRQVCGKGNACLTCDKFATDATFLPELKIQQTRTSQLVEERRQAFRARTGQEMSDDNIWLAGRRQEKDALGRIIIALEETRPGADGTVQAVRGAGVDARTDAITFDQEHDWERKGS